MRFVKALARLFISMSIVPSKVNQCNRRGDRVSLLYAQGGYPAAGNAEDFEKLNEERF